MYGDVNITGLLTGKLIYPALLVAVSATLSKLIPYLNVKSGTLLASR